MKSSDLIYFGSNQPFAGDRSFWLHCLPSGARVTRAITTLEPAQPAADVSIVFDETNGSGDWGATRLPAGLAQATSWSVTDLHARRTITGIRVAQAVTVTLEIDVGGTWLPIAEDGTLLIAPSQNRLELQLAAETRTVVPALTTTKLKLNAVSDMSGAIGTVILQSLTVQAVPTNASVRLGDLPPVWTCPGELGTTQSSPDFAFVFNAVLAEATAQDGFYAIPVIVHSDTIAQLNFTLSLDYVVDQPLLPPHLPEVTLPYGFSTLPELPVDLTLRVPHNATIVATSGIVQGTFTSSRVVAGGLGKQTDALAIAIDPAHMLAQPVCLDQDVAASSIDLALASTTAGLAGLHLAFQGDADGEPSGVELISVPVQVSRLLPGGTAWGNAALPGEFRFLADERYWLVLQSVTGTANWEAQPDADGTATLLVSADGGRSWRPAASGVGASPLAALYRLRHTPVQFSIPVHLQIDQQPELVHFDRYAPLGRVDFALDVAAELGRYLDSPEAAPPCGTGNLLVNGSFDLPPHDDATRRLFGFDAGSAPNMKGSVDLLQKIDLSRERFIRLSVCGRAPMDIDCAGNDPASTSIDEIVGAINRNIRDGKIALSANGYLQLATSCCGAYRNVDLLSWRRSGPPQGWYCPQETQNTVYREKAPTILYPASIANQVKRVSDRVVALLEPEPGEQSVLAQKMDATAGCTYALRFLFGHVVNFSYRPVSSLSNPLNESDIEFRVLDLYGNLKTQASIKESVHGIQGLDCDNRLEIRLPFNSSLIELSLSIKNGDYASTSINTFANATSVATKTLTNSGLHVVTLTGEAIDRIEIESSDCTTLLHRIRWVGSAGTFTWEINWFDREDRRIGRVDAQIDAKHRFLSIANDMFQCEALVVAPPTTTAAEIRFIQSDPGTLRLDDVALMPTTATVSNPDFRHWLKIDDSWQPADWQLVSGQADPAYAKDGTQFVGICLSGNSTADTVITQRVAVRGDGDYELRAYALATRLVEVEDELPAAQRARLELTWRADTTAIAAPIVLPLDERTFGAFTWGGKAPPRADQAVIRLIQPQGSGTLFVGQVSLDQGDQLAIPLTFLSEAPGELTLADLQVTYDPPSPPLQASSALLQGARCVSIQTTAHPRIARAPGGLALALALPLSPLADRPVTNITGIGERIAGYLSAAPAAVRTIGDLAALNPIVTVTGIGREKLLEFKAAAEQIVTLEVPLDPFAALADMFLQELIDIPATELARRSGQNVQLARQLQQELEVLWLLLDRQVWRELRLRDLLE